jgi:hypothetical protein
MADDSSKRGPADRRDAAERALDVDVYTATGTEADSPEAAWTKIISETFGATPNIVRAGDVTFFASSRSDAFFFDFNGITKLSRRGRNLTAPPSASFRRGPARLIDHRLAFLSNGNIPPSDLKPNTDVLHIGEYYQVPVNVPSQALC